MKKNIVSKMKQKSKNKNNRIAILNFRILYFIYSLFIFYACAHWLGFPTYYDPTTYKNLTDLKPEVLFLYESFKSDPVKEERITKIRLKLAQVYEYEKGKGKKKKQCS